MAKRKRTTPRKRRRTTGLSAAPKRRHSYPRTTGTHRTRHRRRRSLGAGGGGRGVSIGDVTMGGGIGGGLFYLQNRMLNLPWWGKLLVTGGLVYGAVKFRKPNIASGLVGAYTNDMLSSMFGMSDDYVDPNVFQAVPGLQDESGNDVLSDGAGGVYMVNPATGQYEPVGSLQQLQQDMSDSGFNLSDNFNLSEGGYPAYASQY